MGTIQVYNIVTDYGAIGDGSTTHATTNTNAINAAIAAIHSSGAPGIIYIPPSVGGFVVNNGSITISDSNVVLQGAGGMGASSGNGTSTIIGWGTTGSTITITGAACTVRDLAFAANGQQTGQFLYIAPAGEGQVTVSNVHMQSPNVGIALYQNSGGGNYWIERVLMEGTFSAGGIWANVATASVNLRHVIMYHDNPASQPYYGINVESAGELIICDGTDIVQMGNCLIINPGPGQGVQAVFVSDSLFDSGNSTACVAIMPTGNETLNGYVTTVRFSNVWTSTGLPELPTPITNNADGFHFAGTTSVNPYPFPFPSILDVSLVNCVAKGFVGHDGLVASNVVGLSVSSSTFGDNYVGINIGNGMSNFALIGNKCGAYVPDGYNPKTGLGNGNVSWGIQITSAASDHFTVIGNLLSGNGGTIYNGAGTGANKVIEYNVG